MTKILTTASQQARQALSLLHNMALMPRLQSVRGHFFPVRFSIQNIVVVMIMYVAYHSPDGDIPVFLHFLEQIYDHLSINYYCLFMGGDCKIDMSAVSSQPFALGGKLKSFGFWNVNNDAMRVTTSSSSIIDLLITSVKKDQVTACSVISHISDHLPIVSSVKQHYGHPESLPGFLFFKTSHQHHTNLTWQIPLLYRSL